MGHAIFDYVETRYIKTEFPKEAFIKQRLYDALVKMTIPKPSNGEYFHPVNSFVEDNEFIYIYEVYKINLVSSFNGKSGQINIDIVNQK